MKKYQLRTDSLGRKRLNLQASLYNPGSYQFLISQGIKQNQTILEVGCGSGSMTTWLAEQVGKKGKVIAIDNSSSQIKATTRLVDKLGLKQVKCIELSVFDLDKLKEKFDIVYIRCVLIHLSDPILALKKGIQALKKNGIIVIDEILNSCNFCFPEQTVFAKRRYVIEQFFKRNGLNPNFGLTLKSEFKKLKLIDIQESLYQPILKKNQRKLLSLFLIENKEKFIALGILTEQQWKKLLFELQLVERDKDTFVALSSLYQICGRKRQIININ